MNTLIEIAVALTAGLMLSRLTKLVKLPAVTAYLVAGILIGPFCLGQLGVDGLGFISFEATEKLSIISDVALGFIAFSIGNEFRVPQLKKIGKQATVIGIVQALTATLFVDIALIILHFIIPDKISIPSAIILGAIATATAPAATLMVVRQYKAKGKLTDILLPVVALDDAVGLVVFAVSFGIARAMIGGEIRIVNIILEPLIEVVLSLALGAAMGFILNFFEKFFESNTRRLCMIVTFVMATVGLSMIEFNIGDIHIAFSSLLVCMMLGTVFCNICKYSEELMEKTDKWTAPLFVLFFVISGAELELSVFKDGAIIGIGLIFILFRSLGKYIGSFASAKATGCDENIVKYLGITLLPQAGVALGMCLKASALGNSDGALIRNIVLFAVLVYELIGPYLTKVCLIKSGDISPKADNPRKTNSNAA
ncbi:MAG: cation:proton antiporter [Firmicutes bacterium]|nr:cation:proton antiporter [Bacillota bacterium]